MSLNIEGKSGRCVPAAPELCFFKNVPCREFNVPSIRSGCPYRGFRLTGTAGGRFAW